MKLSLLLFYWSYVDAHGRWRSGYAWASSVLAIERRLGAFPVAIATIQISAWMVFHPRWWWRVWKEVQARDALTLTQLALFCSHVHSLLAGGLSLYRALCLLAHASTDGKMKEATAQLVATMERGQSASAAFLHAHTKWPLLIPLALRALDEGGDSASFFRGMSTAFYAAAHHRSDLMQALSMPLITAVSACFVLLFAWHMCASQQIVPAVSGSFDPLFLACAALSIIGGGTVAWHGASRYKRLLEWRDYCLLRLPFFGKLFSYADALVFLNVSALLLHAGVDVVRTLAAVQPLLKNAYWHAVLNRLQDDLEKGVDFVAAVQALPSFCIPLVFSEAVVTVRCARDMALVCQNTAHIVSAERSMRLALLRTVAPLCVMLFVGIFILFFVSYLYQAVLAALPSSFTA